MKAQLRYKTAGQSRVIGGVTTKPQVTPPGSNYAAITFSAKPQVRQLRAQSNYAATTTNYVFSKTAGQAITQAITPSTQPQLRFPLSL